MSVYADASVLVSLITEDGNSDNAKILLRGYDGVLIWTDFLKLEVTNAIRMGVREKRVTEKEARSSLELSKQLIDGGVWHKREVDWVRVFARAHGLSNAHTSAMKVRSLDILHVASAMDLGVGEFWSFDKRQRALAAEVGLRVNP